LGKWLAWGASMPLRSMIPLYLHETFNKPWSLCFGAYALVTLSNLDDPISGLAHMLRILWVL